MKPKKEHPDDRRCRLSAQRWARERSQVFVRSRLNKLARLFHEFGDADAVDMFRQLREQFWERY